MTPRKPRPAHPIGGDARGGAREPTVENERRWENRIERRLRVPEDLPFLEGHFANFPVVPGTVQLGWAVAATRALLGHPAAVRCVEALKFPTLLRPGDVALLRVEVSADGTRLHFGIETPGESTRVFASGRFTIGDPP